MARAWPLPPVVADALSGKGDLTERNFNNAISCCRAHSGQCLGVFAVVLLRWTTVTIWRPFQS